MIKNHDALMARSFSSINKQEILKSITRPEEQLLVAKAFDSAFLCYKKHQTVFTDFHDPKSASTVLAAVSKIPEISALRYGGHDCCERTIFCFFPKEMEPTLETAGFPIKTLFIDSSKFIKTLTHRDFLGAILGLGLDRRKIGDIFVENGNASVYVKEETADFIIGGLTDVGRAAVKVSELQIFSPPYKNEAKTITATVSSMRADAVLGEAFNLSRSKSADFIKSEKVFVNWEIITSASKEIKEGDVISLRGSGRAEVRNICGTSKKGRVILEIDRY